MSEIDTFVHNLLNGLGWPAEAIVQLVMAAVAGGLVGLEREMRGRQAGFRTNLLVSVGSALVVIVSSRFAYADWPTDTGFRINVDPARVAYGVMTGVGFLGAGTIIQHRGSVRGLTTAAGLWCVAAIGMAAGLGLYVVGLAATILVVVALWILDHMEDYLPRLHYRDVTVRRRWEPGCIQATIQRFKEEKFHVSDVSFQRSPDLSHADIELRVAFMDKQRLRDFERNFEADGQYQVLSVKSS